MPAETTTRLHRQAQITADGDQTAPDVHADPPPTDKTTQRAPASGRLMLRKPGQRPTALPDDISLEEIGALLDDGSEITIHPVPGGPPQSVLLPLSDPRMKYFEAGLAQGRRTVIQPSQPTIQNIETAHIHFHGVTASSDMFPNDLPGK